jgi:hypothetical protein
VDEDRARAIFDSLGNISSFNGNQQTIQLLAVSIFAASRSRIQPSQISANRKKPKLTTGTISTSLTISTPDNNSDRRLIMISTQRTSNIVIFLSVLAGAFFLAGCAGVGSANTESLLTAAGFRARTPQTPKQQQIYAALPPYQVERATVPGKGVFYVYKDERSGFAYVGREQEYQRYQQLAVQQQIAQNYYMAAEMDRAAAWQWYGAWGPRAFWW